MNIETPTNKVHYYWLDALRFIAAFMVLFSHTRMDFFLPYGDLPVNQQTPLTFVFYFLGRLGHEAVIIFFVLSGFLVGGLALERIHNKTFHVGSYSIDRFTRIAPPFVTAIFLSIITSLVFAEPIDWFCVVGNLLQLQGVVCPSLVSPFWSLSYEVWFYILIAALACSFSDKKAIKWLGITCFTIICIIFVSGLSFHYMAIWILGAIAYLIRPKTRNVWILIISIIGFLGCVVWLQITTSSESISFVLKNSNRQLIEVIYSFFTCLFIQQLIISPPQSKIACFIERNLGKMAKFSYTLYLSHRIVMLWIFAFIFNEKSYQIEIKNMFLYIIMLLIILLVCYMIYYVSERYSPQLRKWMKLKLCNQDGTWKY